MNYEYMTLPEVRKYYGRRYKVIFDALEAVGATDISIDKQCGRYLELSCRLHNERALYDSKGAKFAINIGLNNKYNTWFNRAVGYTDTARHAWDTQTEAAKYIKIKGGVKVELSWEEQYYDIYNDGLRY